MPQPPAWTIADLIDFEHLLASPAAAAADRVMFEQHIAPRLAAKVHDDRAAIFRTWVQVLREDPAAPGLGSAFETGQRVLRLVAIAAATLAGAGLAGSLLAQPQGEPVNALMFLAWTVGLQLLLLTAVTGAWLLRRVGVEVAPLRGLMSWALAAAGRAWGHLPGEQRLRWHAALARAQQRGRLSGGLLTWPAVILAQQAALAFNAGVLAAMLFLHLPFAELRFGWQSTYELDAATVHRAVAGVATPWRAWWPAAQPTLGDVVATRYTRGQAAASLPSVSARTWWPFLALAVAFYGLLLRVLLLVAARVMLRRRLGALAFRDADANALWRRLQGPLIDTAGGTALADAEAPLPRSRTSAAGTPCVALVADELAPATPEHDALLRARIAERLGWRVEASGRVRIDDRQSVAGALPPDASPRALVIVVPAERDPIVAIALFLRDLRAAVHGEVVVLLWPDEAQGTTAATAAGRAVDPERITVWRRFLAIHKLDVGVEAAA